MADENRLQGVPLLDKTFQFLIDQFRNQPPWLRAFVYFIFVIFFVTTATRLIGGRYVVKGVIWNGEETASDCEVRLNGEFYSTNARGEYYALLNSTQYYSLLFSRSIVLPVVRDEHRDHSYRVRLKAFDDQFEDIDLGRNYVAEGEQSAPSQMHFELIPSAYAQAIASVRSRDVLFVDRLALSAAAAKVRSVDLQMGIKGQPNPHLQSLGDEAGNLPVRGAAPVTLRANSYYFSTARSLRGKQVTIELNGPAGFFQNFHETFQLTIPSQSKSFSISGDKGSVVTVHFVANS